MSHLELKGEKKGNFIMSIEKATFGGGCFWKVEDSFLHRPGVIKTSAGYMGGHFPHPSYLDVLYSGQSTILPNLIDKVPIEVNNIAR